MNISLFAQNGMSIQLQHVRHIELAMLTSWLRPCSGQNVHLFPIHLLFTHR